MVLRVLFGRQLRFNISPVTNLSSSLLTNIIFRLSQLRGFQTSSRIAASSSSTETRARQQREGVEEPNNEPIKFFGSQAGAWRAKETRSGGADEALWYQPYVISASLAAFLIYFCVLREENDIDQKLGKSLFDHIEGLEEQQLVIMYKYNRENGLDNSQVVARLKELNIDVKSVMS